MNKDEAISVLRGKIHFLRGVMNDPSDVEFIDYLLEQTRDVEDWEVIEPSPITTVPKETYVQLLIRGQELPRIGYLRGDLEEDAWYLHCTLTGQDMLIGSGRFGVPTHWARIPKLPKSKGDPDAN